MKTLLIAQIVHLKISQMLSSVEGGKSDALQCSEGRKGTEDIYLGVTYKETKTAWRLASSHTRSQRKNPHLLGFPPRPI